MNTTNLQYLYKYRSLVGPQRDWTRSIIEDCRLFFSSPLAFNDPFDCLPKLTFEASVEELADHFRKYVHSRGAPLTDAEILLRAHQIAEGNAPDASQLDEMFRKTKEKLGVLSLSECPDHVLLWSHYADSHRGVCLRFDATDNTPFFGEAQKVTYASSRPVLNIFRQTIDEQIDNALMTKADFWSYEMEWRIFNHHDGPGLHAFPGNSLSGLILGAQMPADDCKEVLEWVATLKRPVEVLKATFDADRFRLNIKPYQ